MNTFECRFVIGEKTYNLYIDSSKDEWKRIVLNNKEVVNDKYTLALNSKAYIIYYPIEIDGNELIVSIDDNPLIHTYNVYLNKKSIIDGTDLEEKIIKSKDLVKNGFWNFVQNNWLKVFISQLPFFICMAVIWSVKHGFTFRGLCMVVLSACIFLVLWLPVFIIGEWVHNKNIIKKYKNCFRPKMYLIEKKGIYETEVYFVSENEIVNK